MAWKLDAFIWDAEDYKKECSRLLVALKQLNWGFLTSAISELFAKLFSCTGQADKETSICHPSEFLDPTPEHFCPFNSKSLGNSATF
ncbi:hypothetical protein CEXT_763891 [Caerostris extrusa]|uniref:Uncharacterized protein n=1 Tax=Caerostris extrusa TaxID=172846 RepID=A0AAV4S2G2_CAEEX|nr:hypothetical protein CEXT_763891 [Caerostris extrusa]